jgi:hypothetical protein
MASSAASDCPTQPTRWSLPRFLLRKGLRGRWALLFSHPDDFAHHGFEADRWVEQVKQTFQAESIVALAVGARVAGSPEWMAAIGGSYISQRTFDSIIERSGGRDYREDRGSERRYVMILDGELQVRRTILYARTDRVPSPIGLASLAAVCRVRAESAQRPIA